MQKFENIISITQFLIKNAEPRYKEFSKKLVPDTKYEIIGVRVPLLKKLAKNLKNTQVANDFLNTSHIYYEEWFLHGLLISQESDFEKALALLDKFIPHIDNWAICDSFVSSLKIIKHYPSIFYDKILRLISSELPYVKRVAIVIFLNYFLDDNFNSKTLTILSGIISDNYYVNMALAWYFSVALVKQYNDTIPYFTNYKLPIFVHNQALQKAIESYRVPNEKKTYLKSLKIKKERP